MGLTTGSTGISVLGDKKEKLNRILAENTGRDYEIICADTERDNWKSAKEAMEYGLIDRVITDRAEAK